MNIREMHVDVKQGVQQVAANRSRKYLDEEIDLVLNKMIERYIRAQLRPKTDGQGRLTGGFEIDQAGAENISGLLKLGVEITPWIDNSTRYKCLLPVDYQFLIADWSHTTNLCGTTPEVTTANQYATRVRQDRTAKSSAPFYETLSTSISGTLVAIPGDLPYGHTYTGYRSKLDIGFIIPWIAMKGGWYWERFDGLYYPSHYIKVQSTTPSGTTAIMLDAATPTVTTGLDTITRTRHAGEGVSRANRLTPSDIVPNLNGAAFYKTSHYSPISELNGGILWLHKDNSFTVNKVFISYIRKSQPVSLGLNLDCELPETTHRSICDLAIEYIKGEVQNAEGKQLKTNDLTERVII